MNRYGHLPGLWAAATHTADVMEMRMSFKMGIDGPVGRKSSRQNEEDGKQHQQIPPEGPLWLPEGPGPTAKQMLHKLR